MLAQQPLHGEDAAATVSAGAGRLAHLRERASAGVDALEHLAVADDLTVADDHKGEATLTGTAFVSAVSRRHDRSSGSHARFRPNPSLGTRSGARFAARGGSWVG